MPAPVRLVPVLRSTDIRSGSALGRMLLASLLSLPAGGGPLAQALAESAVPESAADAIAAAAVGRPAAARVGRLSLVDGDVSYFAESSAGAGWVAAQTNLPLLSRTSLATGANARAEVRIGTTTVALDAQAQMDVSRLDDDALAIAVPIGAVAVTVSAFDAADRIELSAGRIGMRIRSAGTFVLRLEPSGTVTAKAVDGQAELQVGLVTLTLIPAQQVRIEAGEPLAYRRGDVVLDGFDDWVADRNQHWQAMLAQPHLSPEMTGAEILPNFGTWTRDPAHGAVWYPSTVPGSWAPYQDGRWTIVEPWGPVWVDAAPWGFATSHFGRWQQVRGRWGWIPGAHATRPVFSPPRVAPPRPAPLPVAGPWQPPRFQPPPPREGREGAREGGREAPRGDPRHPAVLPVGPAPVRPPSFGGFPPPGPFPAPPRAYPTPPRDYPQPARVQPPQRTGPTPPAFQPTRPGQPTLMPPAPPTLPQFRQPLLAPQGPAARPPGDARTSKWRTEAR